MKSETKTIGETKTVSETVTYGKSTHEGVRHGDCMTCSYKSNTTSGFCPTYALFGWCKQTMGEYPPDIKEPETFYQQSIKWVNATPDEDYPLRILRAYLDYTDTRTNPPELGHLLNELQYSRNLLLEKAIEILGKHSEELRETLKEELYNKGVPMLDSLETY